MTYPKERSWKLQNIMQKSNSISCCSTQSQKELENLLMRHLDDRGRHINTWRNLGPNDMRPSNMLSRQLIKQVIKSDLA